MTKIAYRKIRVAVLANPVIGGEVKCVLNSGESITLLGESEYQYNSKYLKIRTESGIEGWLPENVVEVEND